MIYKINNKIIIINPFQCLGSGIQGNVYKYQDKALKIYDKIYRTKYNQDRDETLSTLSTKYIILPEESVFSTFTKYCGYKMPYIDLDNDKKITDCTKEDLKENLFELIEDINVISKNDFKMEDVKLNTVFNGKIYVLDSSCYFQEGKEDEIVKFILRRKKGNILEDNIAAVKSGIHNLICNELILDKESELRMIDLFSNINSFSKKLGEGETIKQYILRK